jgi:hypothetical protein
MKDKAAPSFSESLKALLQFYLAPYGVTNFLISVINIATPVSYATYAV